MRIANDLGFVSREKFYEAVTPEEYIELNALYKVEAYKAHFEKDNKTHNALRAAAVRKP